MNFMREQCIDDVLAIIDNQEEQARDRYDNRFVKCEKCGVIATSNNFVYYGGQGRINIGGCMKCFGRK